MRENEKVDADEWEVSSYRESLPPDAGEMTGLYR